MFIYCKWNGLIKSYSMCVCGALKKTDVTPFWFITAAWVVFHVNLPGAQILEMIDRCDHLIWAGIPNLFGWFDWFKKNNKFLRLYSLLLPVCGWRLTVTCPHGLHLICSPCCKVYVVHIYSYCRSTLEYHPSSGNARRLEVRGGLCVPSPSK